jgi:hypothetical protein
MVSPAYNPAFPYGPLAQLVRAEDS